MAEKQRLPKTQECCVVCGNSIQATDAAGKKVCPVCGSHEFKTVTLPKEVRCPHCGKVWRTADVLKVWKDIPFFDSRTNTFYDGCHGWD